MTPLVRHSGNSVNPVAAFCAGLHIPATARHVAQELKSGNSVSPAKRLPEFKALRHNDIQSGKIPPPYGGGSGVAGLPSGAATGDRR